MKTFICKSPFQAYNTVLNKHTVIHTGACFISLSDGKANEQGLLLLHGITADDDKKMWVREHVFKEYFEPTVTPVEFQDVEKLPIPARQTMLEALYA
jgi:polyphosphate kinase